MRKLMMLGAVVAGLTFTGSAPNTAEAQYYSYGRSYYPSYSYRSYGYSPYRYGYRSYYSPRYYGYGNYYNRGWNRNYYNRGWGYGRGWRGGSGIYYRGDDFGIGIRF